MLQSILSQIRWKDEIRLWAVLCRGTVTAVGSTNCTVRGATLSSSKSWPTLNFILQTAKGLRDVRFWQLCCWIFGFTSWPAEKIVNPVGCMLVIYKGCYRRKLLMQHSMVAYDSNRNALIHASVIWRMSLGFDLIHGPCGTRLAA